MSNIDWGDAAGWVSGVATAIALAFAAWQVTMFRRQMVHDRRVEVEGVAVSWRAPIVPRSSDDDGGAVWRYEFTAHNPGRLPITDVEVAVSFPVKVQRLHHDGHLGSATSTLKMATPVIPGSGERTWARTVRLPFAARTRLAETVAAISFRDAEGEERCNEWPRHRALADDANEPDLGRSRE